MIQMWQNVLKHCHTYFVEQQYNINGLFVAAIVVMKVVGKHQHLSLRIKIHFVWAYDRDPSAYANQFGSLMNQE